MSGTKISIVSLLFAVSSLFAANVDYFPLQTGNQWVYAGTGRAGAQSRTTEVQQTVNRNGTAYLVYSGLEGDVQLRTDENGSLYSWDEQKSNEVLLAPFAKDDGVFQPSPNPCGQTGRIVSRNAKYKGPVGEFENALEIRYSPGACADAGVEREIYLPYVGLVQRTVTTFAGPRTFDLVYARMGGGITVISAAEVSFSVSLDRAAYTVGDRMLVRFTIRNTQAQPLRLHFQSGKVYDVAVINDKGERVYVWSADRIFTQALKDLDVVGEKNFPVDVPLDKLAPGKYTLEAWLATATPPEWRASAPFEIR